MWLRPSQTAVLLSLAPLVALAVAACRSTGDGLARGAPPPAPRMLFEIGEPLVNVGDTIPDIAVELAYATADNITAGRLYPRDMPALLDRSTAALLKKAQAELAPHGRGLKIWDAYRPPEVQWELWRRSGKTGYVADPRGWWSKHCSGRAVDVTLTDLESGRELPMPSGFDDFSKRAASSYTGPNAAVRENMRLLREAMLNAGFKGIEMEWWHYANAEHYSKNIAPIPAAEAGIDLSHLGDIKTF